MSRKLKKTYELLAKTYKRVPSLLDELKAPFRVDYYTLVSWARPKPTKEEDFHTGKGNPLDRVQKLLDEIYPYDPEMAREIAGHFSHYVDELDRREGINQSDDEGYPCAKAKVIAELNFKLFLTVLGNCDDPDKMHDAIAQILVVKSNLNELEACLKKLAETKNERE